MSIILEMGSGCESRECGLPALSYSDSFYDNLFALFSGDNAYPMILAIPFLTLCCMDFPTEK